MCSILASARVDDNASPSGESVAGGNAAAVCSAKPGCSAKAGSNAAYDIGRGRFADDKYAPIRSSASNDGHLEEQSDARVSSDSKGGSGGEFGSGIKCSAALESCSGRSVGSDRRRFLSRLEAGCSGEFGVFGVSGVFAVFAVLVVEREARARVLDLNLPLDLGFISPAVSLVGSMKGLGRAHAFGSLLRP